MPRTQWRSAMNFLLFCVLGSTWSVVLFQAASDRGYEPFKEIVFRSRVAHFYRQHAPDKVSNVAKIVLKNKGKEEELFSSLAQKYDQPAAELEVTSLVLTCAEVAYEKSVAALAPPQLKRRLEGVWRGWKRDVKLPQQVAVLTATAFLIVSGGGFHVFATAPEARGATFFFYEVVLLVLLLRPSPFAIDGCSLAALRGAALDLWDGLTAEGGGVSELVGGTEHARLMVVSTAAAVAMFLRERRTRRCVLIAWVLALLVLTNPGLGYSKADFEDDYGDASNDDRVVIAALDSIAGQRQSGWKLYQKLPKGSVAVHDLGILSVATWSRTSPTKPAPPEGAHSWLSPVLSLGVGGRWRGALEGSVSTGKGEHSFKMKGRTLLPAWSVPATAFLVTWAIMQLPF